MMTALVVILGAIVAVLGVALIFARSATKRAADLALAEVARSVEAAITAETQQKKDDAEKKLHRELVDVPKKTDAELEAEINK